MGDEWCDECGDVVFMNVVMMVVVMMVVVMNVVVMMVVGDKCATVVCEMSGYG